MVSLLVVDDDIDLCEVLQKALEGEGRTVDVAHDDVGALRKVEERDFDLVLTDLELRSPRDGLDVLKAIRSRSPRTQVILMTAFGSLETAVEGVRAGAYDYLSKPFDVRALLALVERALAASGPPLAPAPAGPPLAVGLVGRTAGMHEVYKQIALAADSQTGGAGSHGGALESIDLIARGDIDPVDVSGADVRCPERRAVRIEVQGKEETRRGIQSCGQIVLNEIS